MHRNHTRNESTYYCTCSRILLFIGESGTRKPETGSFSFFAVQVWLRGLLLLLYGPERYVRDSSDSRNQQLVLSHKPDLHKSVHQFSIDCFACRSSAFRSTVYVLSRRIPPYVCAVLYVVCLRIHAGSSNISKWINFSMLPLLCWGMLFLLLAPGIHRLSGKSGGEREDMKLDFRCKIDGFSAVGLRWW